ncbi:MAG TPA: RecX family transcriptional regulator [Vicinamibacterales bacterium]|nr:RecX family transcriptional regulator [Acidobacteriota bacterium]HOC16879.1 RecX family transcriptional regulator [Vicinamibacterales bacterium]
MSNPAYSAALAMLARRELSERQLRERLERREHPPTAIEEAVTRLRASGLLDDRRVARAAARVEAQVRSRGRLRVLQRLHALGIAPEVAAEAADEVFGAIDEDTLLEAALARRLRGPAARIRDAAHFRRLHQQLVRQGFAPSAVTRALKRHWRGELEQE